MASLRIMVVVWGRKHVWGVDPALIDRAVELIGAGRSRASPQSPDWAGRAVGEALGYERGDGRVKLMLDELLKARRLKMVKRKFNGKETGFYDVV